MAPSCILSIVFFCGTVASVFIANIYNYNFYGDGFVAIILTTLLYGFSGYLVKIMFYKKEIGLKCVEDNQITSLLVPKKRTLLAISFISILLVFLEIIFLCSDIVTNNYELNDLTNIGSTMRANITDGFNFSLKTRIIFQLNIGIWVLAYYLGFIFIKNLVYKINNSKVFTLTVLINTLSFLVSTSVVGSRTATVNYFFAMIYTYYFLIKAKTHWKKRIQIKFIGILLLLCVFGSIFFVAVMPLIGRSYGNTSPLQYVAYYLGGGVIALDYALNNNMKYIIGDNNSFLGKVFLFLKKIGLYSKEHIVNSNDHGFIPWGTRKLGNVYTSVFSRFYEGGLFGWFILTFLESIFYNIYYYIIKLYNNNPVNIVIYVFLSSAIFLQFFNDLFYNQILSHTTVEFIVILLIIYRFMNNKSRIFNS